MNKIERKDGKVFIDDKEYAPVDKPKFPERALRGYAVLADGDILGIMDSPKKYENYNIWESEEFAELVSADQRRRNAMWQAVYMFDPESKGRGRFTFRKDYRHKWVVWSYEKGQSNETSIGVNNMAAAQNCIDWLTAEGIE